MRRARPHRFHPVFALRYVKFALLTCLVPMINALLKWDINALFTALWQDLSILIVFGAAAWLMWYTTSFSVEDTCVRMQQGVIVKKNYVFKAQSIAVLEIERPLFYRFIGASKLTMYFKQQTFFRKFTLYLPKKTAAHMADTLMPVNTDKSVFAPMGYERLAFVMLSTNVLTAWFFIYMTLRNASEILGSDLSALAQENFSHITHFLEHFLPMGVAAIMSAGFIFVSATVLYSSFRTAGFRVCRNGGVIVMRGGLLEKIERRIYVQSISACDMRITPAARLLNRAPLYISAGSFKGGDIPLMVVKRGGKAAVNTLLPSYTPPKGDMCTPKRKSIVEYLWQPGAIFAVFLLLLGAAWARMPDMLPVLLIPTLMAAGCMAVSYEGYLREGICKNENRTLSVIYTRFFTRHEVCVFTPDASYTIAEQPFGVSAGWCDFFISLPGHIKLRVRGVMRYVADRIPFLT